MMQTSLRTGSGHRALSTPARADRGRCGRQVTVRGPRAAGQAGCRAIAEAVADGRPDMVALFPAPPQAAILAALTASARADELAGCRFTSADSEFAAMSAAMAAASSGDLVYSATASCGLLQASEAVFGSADLRLALVLTFAGWPAGVADTGLGWIRLYASTSEEVASLHGQAFQIAREFSMPVLVAVAAPLLPSAWQGPLGPTRAAGV